MHAYRAIQSRRRRHGRHRVRQQPAHRVRAHARHRRWRRRAAVGRCRCRCRTSSRPGSRSSVRTRWPRSGTCTSTERRPSSSRRSRCRRASTRAATRTRCTATRSPSTTCSASKLVADPLHKLDCCVISDGGCCIILTTEERARELAAPARCSCAARPAARRTTRSRAMADMTVHRGRRERPEGVRGGRASRPADVDVFAMYDSFTYTVLVVLEDLGFAPKGEGGAFVADKATSASAARCRPTPTAAGLSCDASRACAACSCCAKRRVSSAAKAASRRSPTPRSRSRTAVAAGCRRRARSCSERSRHDLVRVARIRLPVWSETPKYLVPRPTPEDREFWEGARRGELRIQHCTTCGKHQHYPRMLCSTAARRRSSGSPRRGSGTVYSFTVDPAERRAAVQRAGAVRRRNRRPRRGRRAHDRGDARSSRPRRATIGMRVRADVPARERRLRLRRLRAGGR